MKAQLAHRNLKKIGDIYPPFAAKIVAFLEGSPTDWLITTGFRTFREQDSLYALGRTREIGKRTVTNALSGQSAHNYGIAVDLAPVIGLPDNIQIPWQELRLWDELKKLDNDLIEWGGNWASFQDRPHVQVRQTLIGPWEDICKLFLSEGLEACWAELDTKLT